MPSRFIPCLLLACVMLLQTGEAWARRVALVIANADYSHASYLPNPPNDAADIAGALRGMGFEVTEHSNLGVNELGAALRAFAAQARGAEIAAVFYSGHGIAVDGISRLVPVDALLADPGLVDLETVSLDTVLSAMSGAEGLKLAILDSCRENPFGARMSRMNTGAAMRNITRGMASIEPRQPDTLVWYAARDGQLASDGAGRNSPFTGALLRHLNTPGLEIGKLFRVVRDDVLQNTGVQEPFVYGSRGATDTFLVEAHPQAVSDNRNPCTLIAPLKGYCCTIDKSDRVVMKKLPSDMLTIDFGDISLPIYPVECVSHFDIKYE